MISNITAIHTSTIFHPIESVRVYDYIAREHLCKSKFNSPGSCLLWLPKIVCLFHLS